VQAYIEHCRAKLIAEGQDPDRLMRESSDTSVGTEILMRFAKVTRERVCRVSEGLSAG
jgi:hypothetical protein